MVQPIKEQYASSKNLESRMSIYQYSIDSKTFPKWLTEQIIPAKDVKILELGCGTGDLWKDLKDSFHDCEIHLSDLSEGMLERSKENLGENAFNYEIIDFHNIPYPDKTFDIIISNHNLYHALDLNIALGEISRVIKDNGVFYSTTNSSEHLASLRDLINITDDTLWPNGILTSIFGAETGIKILSHYFQKTERRFYQNELRITHLDPIINYFMSVRNEHVHQIIRQSADTIQEKFETEIREQGYYKVKTKACLFICRK
ncbi:MAG: class I SAM-dependent methyltransferase [Anaerolineaceae bacterium]|nr:class I SAM-dependent methyltransferase [Anaerolineaceae bacterium]